MKRLLFSTLLFTVLIGLPEIVRSQGTVELNPRVVGQIFFDAMFDGDLQVFKAHRLESAENFTQEELDATRKMLNGQRPAVQTAWQTQTRHRAIIVSSMITLKDPDGEDGSSGRFVLDMDDTLGKWLIRVMEFETDEGAARRVTEFRSQYSEDARDVPALKAKQKLTVIQVEHADATAVSAILNELFDEFSIVVDGRTNSLFVRYDEKENIDQFSEVAQLLDQPVERAKNTVVASPDKPAKRENPCETTQRYFNALARGNLETIKSLFIPGTVNEKLTQEQFDSVRTMLGDQRPTIISACSNQPGHEAITVTSTIHLRDYPTTRKTESGRFVLNLDDSTGKWLIAEIHFVTEEQSTAAIDEFRRKHGENARDVPAPIAATETAKPVTIANSKRQLTVFMLEYADATAASGILHELFKKSSIVVDARTNRLFVRFDDRAEIDELSAVLRMLDQPKNDGSPAQPPRQPARLKANQIPQIQNGGSTLMDPQRLNDWLTSGVDAEYVAAVRATAATAEAESIRTAKRIRGDLKNSTDPEQQAEWRAVLRRAVATAFVERQSVQISELAFLRNRLTKIEAQIQARERVRKRIIERRVEDLLDPTLKWGNAEASADRASRVWPATENPMSGLGGSAGLQQTASPQALVQPGGNLAANAEARDKPDRVQVRFTNPQGTKIAWSAQENLSSLVVPARIDLKPGSQHEFALSEIAGREGQQVAGSVQVYPLAKQSAAFVSHNAIPLEFTDEDLDQVTSGNLVTKVVFLPDPKFQELAIAGVETLVSTRTDPGVDAVAEAGRRGVILVVLRLGDRIQLTESARFPKADEESELSLESKVRGGSGILFFESESCSICAKVRPEFTKVMSQAGLPFLSVDVTKHPRIAKQFRVASTPTFVWVSSEVELERATGVEYQELVASFRKYWDESDGSRSGIGFGNGLRDFLRRELISALHQRESLLTDITSLDLVIAELGELVRIPEDASDEIRKSKEHDEMRRKARIQATLETIEAFRTELRPVDAKILLIRNRLQELESGGSPRTSDPQNTVVWIEAIVEHAAIDGKRDASATYMNGTLISSQGHIAVCLGHGSKEEDFRQVLLKLNVNLPGGKTHQGRLLAYDTQTGAAVIKIEAADLPYLRISDDPVADNRRLIVHALGPGNLQYGDGPYRATVPVRVVDSQFQVGDHDGFFAVAEASQTSLSVEYRGAPVVTSSGQLQGILAENEAILFGPAIKPADPEPRRAGAIPANVIGELLKKAAKSAVKPSLE